MGEAGVGQAPHSQAHQEHQNPHPRGQAEGPGRGGFPARGVLRLGLLPVGGQALFRRVVPQKEKNQGRGGKDEHRLDAEGRRHGQALHQPGGHRGQDDGGDAAAGGADAQGQGPVPDEPPGHEDGHGNHGAESIAQPRHRRADAEGPVVPGHAVEKEGRPGTPGGDDRAHPDGEHLVIPPDDHHGHEGHQAPEGDQGGGLGVGQAPLGLDEGQVDGKPVGHRAHGDEDEKGGGGAHQPPVVNALHGPSSAIRRAISLTASS